MKIALIMLAAGNSRRFGSNKLLYEIDGKPMYQHILEKLLSVTDDRTSDVTVVTQYEKIKNVAKNFGARVYINPHPEEGISSSLKIGLRANLDADACLFTVSDQPWLTKETISKLIWLLESSGKGIACVSCEGKLGNPCIFTKKYYEQLLGVTGDRGGKSVIIANSEDTAVLEICNGKELTDVDVKESAVRESSTRESSTRESSTRESPLRESSIKESVVKES